MSAKRKSSAQRKMNKKRKWSATDATNGILREIEPFLPSDVDRTEISTKLRATLAGHVSDYDYMRDIVPAMRGEHVGKLKNLATRLYAAMEAIDDCGARCDKACKSVFGVSASELSELLYHLSSSVIVSHTRYSIEHTPPANRHKQTNIDRLIFDLAHIFHWDLRLPIVARAVNRQEVLHPLFQRLLKSANEALPNEKGMRSEADNGIVRRAKKIKNKLRVKAPSWQPQYYASMNEKSRNA